MVGDGQHVGETDRMWGTLLSSSWSPTGTAPLPLTLRTRPACPVSPAPCQPSATGRPRPGLRREPWRTRQTECLLSRARGEAGIRGGGGGGDNERGIRGGWDTEGVNRGDESCPLSRLGRGASSPGGSAHRSAEA